MPGAVAAGDAGDAGSAGERTALPAAPVLERAVCDAVAARPAWAVEQRPALRRKREAVPVAGLAEALELHRVVGVVEPAANDRREAARGEPVRVVVALDVPRGGVEARQDPGGGRSGQGERDNCGDEEHGLHGCLLIDDTLIVERLCDRAVTA